jgi:hypothetical protein
VTVTVVLVLTAAAAAVAITRQFTDGDTRGGSTGSAAATSLATVQRRTLSTQTQFNGILGYAGSYTVLTQAHGTVTWLPEPGRVVRQGHVLYRVGGLPVVLLYGATPAYRTLAAGATAEDVQGADVAQLNHDLVTLGYLHRAKVDSAWDEFDWATSMAVERLQRRLHVKPTGALDVGDVVFLPTATRVTTLRTDLGGSAGGPVLSATSTTRTVSVALDASLRAEVRVGDRVKIRLPDSSTTPGRVASVGRVAAVATSSGNDESGPGGSNGPTIDVAVRPTHAADVRRLDQALVEVSINDRTVRDVLAVPVDALVARAGGSYAVEVVAGDGTHRLVAVQPGLFDDAAGLVQVSASGLSAGQRVVVPGND